MSVRINSSLVTFDASAKTITLDASVDPKCVSLITNKTDSIVIYQFNKAAKGAMFDGNVMTLVYDTTGMDDSDDIEVIAQEVPQPKRIIVSHHDSSISGLYDTKTIDGLSVASTTAPDNFLVPPINCRGYAQITVEVTGTFVANLSILEGETGSLLTANNAYNGVYNKPTTVISGSGVFHIPVRSTLIAIQCTSYTSGKAYATVTLSAAPFVMMAPQTTNESLLTISNAVTVAADTRASSFDVQNRRQLLFLVNVTAVSGTTPTLDLYIDSTVDGSTPYYRLQTASLGQITATGQYAYPFTAPFGRFASIFYKVGGTSPSFTLTTRVDMKE